MASIKDLKKRRGKLDRRIDRNQKWRKMALALSKRLHGNGRKLLAKQAHNVAEKLHDFIKKATHALREVEKQIEHKKQQGDGSRAAYLKFLEASVGKIEGSEWQRDLTNYLGNPWEWAWCSSLVAYGLIKHGGFTRAEIPSNEEYSGMWLTWGGGERVSYSQAQPGDLLIFDWGDGGITDHVATYIGNGLKIGGNENNRVERDAVPVANVVGVVRPNWDH